MPIKANNLEQIACTPTALDPKGLNPKAKLPYRLETNHLARAMKDFLDFLGIINRQLQLSSIPRLETMLMPANFSSIVGEFVITRAPHYCPTLVKNNYHNGHPDLIPARRFPNNAVQHSKEGIEIKASRYSRNWQGHNPEDCYLMVFVFQCNRPSDASSDVKPQPFRFLEVLGAPLTQKDWIFSGRSETSRRTITASVNDSGYRKMIKNWIYRTPESGNRKQ